MLFSKISTLTTQVLINSFIKVLCASSIILSIGTFKDINIAFHDFIVWRKLIIKTEIQKSSKFLKLEDELFVIEVTVRFDSHHPFAKSYSTNHRDRDTGC